MCGLFGIVNSTSLSLDQKKFITDAIFCGTLRGVDSTGLALIDKDNEVSVFKRALAGPDFLTCNLGQRALRLVGDSFVVMGHNRAATKGAVNNTTAHPFEFGNLVGVHNGTVHSTYQLPINRHPVDSMDILESLSVARNKKKGNYIDVLEKIDGSFALMWYNIEEEILYMARDQQRPLFYIDDEDALYWASESGMLQWLMARNNILPKKYKVICLPEEKLVKYDCRNMKFLKAEKFTKYKWSSDTSLYSGGIYDGTQGYGGGGHSGSRNSYKDVRTGDYVQSLGVEEAIRQKKWAEDDKDVLLYMTSATKVESTNKADSKGKEEELRYDLDGWVLTQDGTGIPVHLWCCTSEDMEEWMENIMVGTVSNVTISSTIPGLFHKVVVQKDSLTPFTENKQESLEFRKGIEEGYTLVDPKVILEQEDKKREKEKREEKRKEGKNNVIVLPPSGKDGQEDLKFRDGILVEDEDKGEDVSNLQCRGPGGVLVDTEEFNKLTEYGCHNCRAPVYAHESHLVGWVNNRYPICNDCIPVIQETWPELMGN